MYLKSIELYGFKSFAERTKIEFNENITCVVGPNGSGKSNVTDAIRWVLGEQNTATLRGSKMQDVIFTGTNNRRGAGLAEVIITFDNFSHTLDLDYTEVAVKRKLYKNGDSEYYINNNPCRLKDVRQLFMDTGIGRDGYSIIGQGRIDAILNSKPIERRSIFEEASGISKFKFQKQDAERKLSKTRENLIRLSDLLVEIESQRNSLKVESDKAENYNKIYYKLLQADINNLSLEILEIRNKIEELKANRLQQVEGKDKTTKLISKLKEDYEHTRNEVEKIELLISDLQLNNVEFMRREKDLSNEINLKEEKLINKENESKEIDIKLDLKEKDILNIEEELILLEKALEEANKETFDFKKALEVINNDLILNKTTANQKAEDLNRLDKDIASYNLKLSENIIKFTSLKSLNEEKYKSIERLKKQFENLESSDNVFKNKSLEISNKLVDLKNEYKTISENYDLLNTHIQELKNEKENLLSINLSRSGEIKNKQFKISTLELMEENYEGYNKSIKDFFRYIRNKNIKFNELYDTVANLISIPSKYEKAITTALGGASQNLVVETFSSAQKIIELLRRENLGRITFLPIDTIKTTLRRSKINADYIDYASNLVESDEKYKKVVDFLLGNVIVTENLDAAKKLYDKNKINMKIVTLDGDILNPGGSVSGGSIKTNGSIINRKNELDALKKELEDDKKIILINVKKIEKISDEIKAKDLEFNNIVDKKSELNNEIIILEKENLELNINNDNNRKNIDDNELQISLLDKEIESTNFEINNINKENESIKKELEKLNLEANKAKKELEQINTNNEILRDRLNNERLKFNNLESENLYTKKNHDRIFEEKNKMQEEIEAFKEIKKTNLSLINKLKEDLIFEREELKAIIEENSKFDLKFKDLNESKKKHSQLLNEVSDGLSNNKEKILEIEKNLFITDNDLQNNFEKESSIFEYISENYKYTLIDFSENNLNIEKILSKSAVKKLKQELNSLGDVNLGAIKNYREVNDRYEFTKKQYNDLEVSENKLQKLLKEIEKTMEEKFNESFTEINKNFNRIFQYLFEGGKAELLLEEGDNPIEAGIDIVAQLPGKKRQLLNAMSGGERSMTTVALLFALLETRPAPFCLLDEVDAALDDANIKRFISYLENLNNIQFAIITHRKTTMIAADYIYGVTMEEPGVSKIISLKFKGRQ